MIKKILYILLLISIILKPIGGYPPVDYEIGNTATGSVPVYISSIPPGADIYINGEYKGITPITINLHEGSYSIKMNLAGYMSIISDFNIISDMVRQEINVTFEPISPNTIVPIPYTDVVTSVQEGKFKVGPTVRIRPLNDVISKDQDGLVELYMDNPSFNNIVLSVYIRISTPIGVHIYGEGFGSDMAGMVYGTFEVPPGSARTINIVIKADRIGDFSAQFSGLYWPGDNKDAYQPISLTHPFKVSNPVQEEKFRVGPTVRIRPLNDLISRDRDGIVELYMDNPSLNNVSLTVDIRISAPSGIHVYGQGFGEADAAGIVYGLFTVPPGSARTIHINIKAEKTGDFYVQFTGMYYPGENKDAYQPISLTHPFKMVSLVNSIPIAIPPPTETIEPETSPINTTTQEIILLLSIIFIIIIIIAIYLFSRDRRQRATTQNLPNGRKRICPRCGWQNDKDSNFCTDCGFRFKIEKSG